MIWKVDGVLQKTPSTYDDEIEDIDNDSYTSKVTGALIDNPIAVGMIKAYFTFDDCTEDEAEALLQQTYKNPMNVTLKCPSVQGGILTAPFRCSKRKSEMAKTSADENTSTTRWKVSFNLMQKSLVDIQK